MTQALEFWCRERIPNHPSAWLYKVAYRQLISELRNTKRRNELLVEHFPVEENIADEDTSFSGEMSDSMLRMLFITCDDTIPTESQLVFTLKSLCGFSIKEIAHRLFITEANVYKRFSRAKQQLKQQNIELNTFNFGEMATRLSSVHRILYLVFTEGYLSSHTDMANRHDL